MYRFLSLILLAALLAFGSQSDAAVTATPVFVQTPKFAHVQITNANNVTAQTLYTCGANGSKIIGMWATQTDTSAHDVIISILNTSTYNLVNILVPINAGSVDTTPASNLMSLAAMPGLPLDSDGNPFFYCASGDVIQAAVNVQLTAGKFMNVFAVVADF